MKNISQVHSILIRFPSAILTRVTSAARFAWLAVLILVTAVSLGQEKSVDAAGKYTPQLAPGTAPSNGEEAEAKLREVLRLEADGPGRYRIGDVRIDSVRRTVTVPATVNMAAGVIEYALVNEAGKMHEALFATTAKPEQIHLACLLLGKPPEKNGATAVPTPEEAREVKVTVTWDTNGPSAEHDLSQMVVTVDDPTVPSEGQPLPIGPWKYTGSATDARGFAATREGSIISLIPDSAALINNPRESAKRDDHHFPNKALVPQKGSSVRLVLTFSEHKKVR